MEQFLDRLARAIGQRGNLTRIANASGISASSILRISRGETRAPGYDTVTAIERALDGLDASQLPVASEEVVSR